MKKHSIRKLLAIWVIGSIFIILPAPQVVNAVIPLCYGLPADDPDVCNGNGTCVAADTCICDDLNRYAGPDCGTPVCNSILATDPGVCSGNGVCEAPDSCSCEDGYSGADCEILSTPTPRIPFLLLDE